MSFSNRNYQSRGSYQNQNFQRNYQPHQQQEFKKSGAVYTKMRNGKHEGLHCVNAWRSTKNGLMKASCFPVDGVEHVGKEKGHSFMRYVVNISNSTTGVHETYWCLMRLDTKVIVIKELGLCISPNGSGQTRSGKRVMGYFGRNYKTR